MPPANTPSDTQPPTPPDTEPSTLQHSLAPTPYLRHLEEVIAAPVPDFASTLNVNNERSIPQTDPAEESWFSDRVRAHQISTWGGRSGLVLTRDGDSNGSQTDDATASASSRRDNLTEPELGYPDLSRHVASQIQRRRLSLREMRERLLGITHPSPAQARTSAPDARTEPNNWVTRAASRQREMDADNEREHDRMYFESTANTAARTDLERALRNYRSARNALRAAQPPATEVIDPFTTRGVQALRQSYLNDISTPGVSSSISEVVERARRARLQRQADFTATDEDRQGNYSYHPLLYSLRDRVASGSFIRIRNTIKYLSDLRSATVQEGFELARRYRLDSLYNLSGSDSHNDIPVVIDNLPFPQPSSWLEPGMVWHGIQSTDREQSPPSSLAAQFRREREFDQWRRSVLRNRYERVRHSVEGIPRWAFSGDAASNFDVPTRSQGLLSDQRGRDRNGQLPGRFHIDSDEEMHSSGDHWPVKVTLHSVDWDTMTISGTMAASQIPDKSGSHAASKSTEGTSMESYFQGEIIDFRQFTLESEEKSGYRVGGAEIDAQYWQRIGPFRQAIAEQGIRTDTPRLGSNDELNKSLFHMFPKDEATRLSDSTQPSGKPVYEADDIMARCISSQRWIQTHIGQEWILMRWKEKCFLNPNNKQNDPGYISRTYTTHSASFTARDQTSWGLTISGFYYVALNRMTGKIDSLYYDPGSQPYQQLKMVPECMPLDGLKGPNAMHYAMNNLDNVGLKRWFPSIELR